MGWWEEEGIVPDRARAVIVDNAAGRFPGPQLRRRRKCGRGEVSKYQLVRVTEQKALAAIVKDDLDLKPMSDEKRKGHSGIFPIIGTDRDESRTILHRIGK